MSVVQTKHSTFVHHIALDPTGALMATCSSDKTVEIFFRPDMFTTNSSGAPSRRGDGWEMGCLIHDHSGPVIRACWCQHREHGPLLATAGADRWIYVYRIVTSSHDGRTIIQALRWPPVRGYEKDVITDVAFVPPQQYHVLLLSTASLDGCVRLYEVHQPQQLPCICKIMPELDAYPGDGPGPDGVALGSSSANVASATANSLGGAAADAPRTSGGSLGPSARGGGVTSIAWFPGASETTMTLLIGAASGYSYLHRYLKDQTTFAALAMPASVVCKTPVEHVLWAPPVGRRFHLFTICSRKDVFIVRMNCVSPSAVEEGVSIPFEVFHYPHGAVSASWSLTATLLYLVSDGVPSTVTVLQLKDPTDHQSWLAVSRNVSAS